VIVNTCGFIDAAVEESLDAIGEASPRTEKLVVTGCLGAKEGVVAKVHPRCSRSPGPGMTPRGVMQAVFAPAPARSRHDPYIEPGAAAGNPN